MKTLCLNLPDYIDIDDNYLKMTVATRLYELGKLSLGQAAQVAGLSKRAFVEFLGKFGRSVFNQEAADLNNDIDYA